MKIRLALLSSAVLLLPPLALLLSEQSAPQAETITGTAALPALLGMAVLLSITFVLDTLSFRRSGSSLLRTQRIYALALGATGAALGVLLACLNFVAPLWISPLPLAAGTLLTVLFCAVLLPAVFIARLWLSASPALLRHLTRAVAVPAVPAEPAAMLLLLAALGGLFGGAVWPAQLDWLLWLSPLLLLIALQLFWHESTVFSGLKHGDWGRVVLGAASGIAMGGSALLAYQLAGGALYLASAGWLFTLQLAAFGLLCLQLGDVIAEQWRGKKRSEIFKKKPFPIPVIAKKD